MGTSFSSFLETATSREGWSFSSFLEIPIFGNLFGSGKSEKSETPCDGTGGDGSASSKGADPFMKNNGSSIRVLKYRL